MTCVKWDVKPYSASKRVHDDPSRSSKVVDFGTNQKHVGELILNSNFGPTLPRFRDIRTYVLVATFSIPPLFRPKFQGVSFRIDPCCWALHRGNTPKLTNREIICEEFQPVWSQSTNVTDGRTDRQTDDLPRTPRFTYTALCIASRGKTTSLLNQSLSWY